MTDAEKDNFARRRVTVILGFYVHVMTFVLVMLMLFAIDSFVGAGWWVQWPFFGWGLGLLVHGVLVFGEAPKFIHEWYERKVQEIKSTL
ncbi:MAG: 2TM domain-containing protein [Hyphomicrobiaceae bacterium]